MKSQMKKLKPRKTTTCKKTVKTTSKTKMSLNHLKSFCVPNVFYPGLRLLIISQHLPKLVGKRSPLPISKPCRKRLRPRRRNLQTMTVKKVSMSKTSRRRLARNVHSRRTSQLRLNQRPAAELRNWTRTETRRSLKLRKRFPQKKSWRNLLSSNSANGTRTSPCWP